MGNPKRSRTVTLLLVLLPLWLVGSGGGALWYYFHKERKQALVEQERFAQAVSVPLIADDLRKIVEIIGERNTSSPTAAANLSRTASMIEGLLGPGNTGYKVKRSIVAEGKWPILEVNLPGKDPTAHDVWVVASYDSPRGSRGTEVNATGLAATLAAAQALASEKPKSSVHFVFLPHSNEQESPVMQIAGALAQMIKQAGPAEVVLCVEAMGTGEALWLNSQDSSIIPHVLVSDLGKVYAGQDAQHGAPADLHNILFSEHLPAARVSTCLSVSSEKTDSSLPFAPTVAASTGRLIELIRRCSEK